ncbi:MAG: TIGR04283 family arsenosugar biosynthesis glycosyltransferase [Bacteroidota bacterium]
MKLSIIIPTHNESENLKELIPYLQQNGGAHIAEILVVDSCSTDDTLSVATDLGAKAVKAPCQGRAPQMNFGAQSAQGEILYFVHADTRPPASFATDVLASVKAGYEMGCYRYVFDQNHWPLSFNAFMTRFDLIFFRGGDQTFYIPKALFEELGGYREDYLIMEEYEFLRRARKNHSFRIIPKDAVVSSRKYEHNSYFRVNFANAVVFGMFLFGASQQRMVKAYRYLLNYRES